MYDIKLPNYLHKMETGYSKKFEENADIYGRVILKTVRRKDYERIQRMEKRVDTRYRSAVVGIAVLLWMEPERGA